LNEEEKKVRAAAASKRWYEKNKFKISEKRRGKRKEEHTRAYAYALEKYGREEINNRARERYKKFPERYREISKRSRRNNPEQTILNRARSSAKQRGLEFNLDLSDIAIPTVCPLLMSPIVLGDYDYSPSIDRINNDLGYIKGNIWIISTLANRMKNTATLSELQAFADSIVRLFPRT
jgi:hypothetical protein